MSAEDGLQPGTLSIARFMTDGSLPRLCDELGQLAATEVALCDQLGRRVRATEGDPPFMIDDEPEPLGDRASIPIMVEGSAIGGFRVDRRAPTHLLSSLGYLADAVSEVCSRSWELNHRVRELEVLYRLTAMLAQASDVGQILEIALDSALDVLDLDAGSIVLFDDQTEISSDERGIELKASRNLSEQWLDDPQPLSIGREFDRRIMAGEIVAVSNLLEDERVVGKDRLAAEGLVGFVTAAMIFQNHPIGAIRLYDHKPRLLEKSEQQLVRSIAQQAAIAIEQARLLELQQHDRMIGRQLRLASQIQRRMLPRRMEGFDALDIAGRYVPSFELGGDFYDAFDVGRPGKPMLGMVIGDVVGKGVPAALLMSSVRASIRAYAQDVYDIDEIVSRTNKALCRDTLESEFVTLWYGVLDPERRHLTYCSAGHEAPMILRVPSDHPPTMADLHELDTGGMVLGIDPSQRYHRGHCELERGDVLMCYTDGLTDTLDFDENRFTKRRLEQALIDTLAEKPDASAEEVIEGIFWRLRQFAGLSTRPDDQTVLVVRVRP